MKLRAASDSNLRRTRALARRDRIAFLTEHLKLRPLAPAVVPAVPISSSRRAESVAPGSKFLCDGTPRGRGPPRYPFRNIPLLKRRSLSSAPYNRGATGEAMNSLSGADPEVIKRSNQVERLGRELAELVDEWSVTSNEPRAGAIASEMIHKARELLRAGSPIASAAKTA